MSKVYLPNKGLIATFVQASTLVTDKPCFLHSLIVNNFPTLAAYRVTGVLNPDATGDYVAAGTHNGKPAYARTDGHYFIWWQTPANSWRISVQIGGLQVDYWYRDWPDIEGEYHDEGDYTGYPTVSVGVTGIVRFCDGQSVNDVSRLYFTGSLANLYRVRFNYPALFSKGLFVYMSVAGISCYVNYRLLKPF